VSPRQKSEKCKAGERLFWTGFGLCFAALASVFHQSVAHLAELKLDGIAVGGGAVVALVQACRAILRDLD